MCCINIYLRVKIFHSISRASTAYCGRAQSPDFQQEALIALQLIIAFSLHLPKRQKNAPISPLLQTSCQPPSGRANQECRIIVVPIARQELQSNDFAMTVLLRAEALLLIHFLLAVDEGFTGHRRKKSTTAICMHVMSAHLHLQESGNVTFVSKTTKT